jgi:hypothetical protein
VTKTNLLRNVLQFIYVFSQKWYVKTILAPYVNCIWFQIKLNPLHIWQNKISKLLPMLSALDWNRPSGPISRYRADDKGNMEKAMYIVLIYNYFFLYRYTYIIAYNMLLPS